MLVFFNFPNLNISDMTPDETGVNNGTLIGNANITLDAERGNVLSLDGGDYTFRASTEFPRKIKVSGSYDGYKVKRAKVA